MHTAWEHMHGAPFPRACMHACACACLHASMHSPSSHSTCVHNGQEGRRIESCTRALAGTGSAPAAPACPRSPLAPQPSGTSPCPLLLVPRLYVCLIEVCAAFLHDEAGMLLCFYVRHSCGIFFWVTPIISLKQGQDLQSATGVEACRGSCSAQAYLALPHFCCAVTAPLYVI